MSTPAFAFLLLALLSPLPAGAGGMALQLGKETAVIQPLLEKGQDLKIEIRIKGKLRQVQEHLGAQLGKITCKGQESDLLVLDLKKDGYESFMVRTTQPPLVGSLWFFEWDPKERAFALSLNERGERYIPVPLEGKVEYLPGNKIQFQESGGGPTVTYAWNGKAFVRK